MFHVHDGTSRGASSRSGVVDPRNIKPILKDIHLRVVGDMLELSATDLEVGIKYFVRDVEVKSAGGIVSRWTPSWHRERIARRAADAAGEGTRHARPGKAAGSRSWDCRKRNSRPSRISRGNALEMEAAVLKEMTEKTIFAVSLEKQRYALNGVLLVTKEKPRKSKWLERTGIASP